MHPSDDGPQWLSLDFKELSDTASHHWNVGLRPEKALARVLMWMEQRRWANLRAIAVDATGMDCRCIAAIASILEPKQTSVLRRLDLVCSERCLPDGDAVVDVWETQLQPGDVASIGLTLPPGNDTRSSTPVLHVSCHTFTYEYGQHRRYGGFIRTRRRVPGGYGCWSVVHT